MTHESIRRELVRAENGDYILTTHKDGQGDITTIGYPGSHYLGPFHTMDDGKTLQQLIDEAAIAEQKSTKEIQDQYNTGETITWTK